MIGDHSHYHQAGVGIKLVGKACVALIIDICMVNRRAMYLHGADAWR